MEYKLKEDKLVQVGNYWCNDCDGSLVKEDRSNGKFFTVSGHAADNTASNFWGMIVFAVCTECLEKNK